MIKGYRVWLLSCLLGALNACGGGGEEGSGNPPAVNPPAATPPAPVNHAPTAAAGADQSVNKGALVTLNGSTSADSDGDSLVYRWAQTSGPAVMLSSTSAGTPTFTAPSTSGVVVLSLIVNDGKVDSEADTVQVTIDNRAPVANAEGDAVVDTGVFYVLNGSQSSDPDSDALTWQWTQVSGPTVVLTELSPGLVRFTTPATAAHLVFSLIVKDGETQSPQYVVAIDVQVKVVNNAPAAIVSADQTVPKRYPVTMDGYGYDPEGAPVTYEWKQVSGTQVALAGANTAHPTFTSPATAGVLEFEFRVSDGKLASAPKRVKITVLNSLPGLFSNGITPKVAYTNDTLSIDVVSYDGDHDPLTTSYTWRRNGDVVTSVTGSSYPASLTTRGDVISLTVSANDGTGTTTLNFSVAIADTLPVLSFTAPTSANYGDDLSFTVSANDVDGDPPGAFVLAHGPAGFTVSTTGTAEWHVAGPMFDRTMDYNWSIGLADYPGVRVSGSIQVTDASRQQPLMRSGIIVPQRREQLLVTDLNSDGVAEIVLANSQVLAVMNKAGSGWVQSWVSPFRLGPSSQATIDAIASAEVTGDAMQEIFVATAGRIVQLAGADRRVRRQYTLPAYARCGALRLIDLDGDGSIELVCRGANWASGSNPALLVLDAEAMSLDWSISLSVEGESLAVGNVDADPAMEIVLGEGYVFDGATHANEWMYGPGFGNKLDVGDFDGDGIGEIAGSTNWSTTKTFNAVLHSPVAEIAANSGGTDEVRAADLDGNGKAELLVADAQGGYVKVYGFDPGTNQFSLSASISSQNSGVSALAIGNADSDPALELVWGTGVSTSGQDILVVSQFSGGALALDWSSESAGQIDGPYVGAHLARVAPSTDRLMFLSARSLSGYGGTRLLTLDPASGAVKQSAQIATNWSGIGTLDIADYDADGIDEAFLSTAITYDNLLATYDFSAGAIEWQSPVNYAQGIASAHADVTGDGAPDFAVIGADGKISVVDPLHSTTVWQSTTLLGGVDIALADLNLDGRQEIVGLGQGFVYLYSSPAPGAAFLQSANAAVSNGIDLLVADIEGDSHPEIVVLAGGTGGQELRIYSYNLQLLRTLPLLAQASTLALEAGSGHRNILVGSGPQYYSYGSAPDTEIRAIDPGTGALVWKSPPLAGAISKNSLRMVDVDGVGLPEIVYGTTYGMSFTR